MHENTLQEDSGVWLILYRLALALICSLTALNIGVLLLAIRRERKVLLGAASPRAFLLERPRAFLYLCCGHRITVIIPAIVLSVLANFNFDFRLYVINLGIYASLSGEVCMATGKCLTALLTISAAFLDSHVDQPMGEV